MKQVHRWDLKGDPFSIEPGNVILILDENLDEPSGLAPCKPGDIIEAQEESWPDEGTGDFIGDYELVNMHDAISTEEGGYAISYQIWEAKPIQVLEAKPITQ